MARCVKAILLAWALVLPAVADAPSPAPEPLTYYAGMPGRLTADQDAEGGNAFASALIEVWRDETVDLRDFGRRLAAVTMHKSGGWQSPEIPRRTPAPDWSFATNEDETRVALVLGDDEVAAGRVQVKFLREERPQATPARAELATLLAGLFPPMHS